MFDFVINEEHTDRELLIRVLKGLHAMSLDLSNVNAALGKLSADVDALITADAAVAKAVADATTTHQAQVDALVPAIASVSAKAEAALAPPVVTPPPPVV